MAGAAAQREPYAAAMLPSYSTAGGSTDLDVRQRKLFEIRKANASRGQQAQPMGLILLTAAVCLLLLFQASGEGRMCVVGRNARHMSTCRWSRFALRSKCGRLVNAPLAALEHC